MFGQSGAGNADMILGRGIFDGASIGGNNYNDNGSLGSASGAAGGSTGFDLNDFPSLGGSGSGGGVSSGDTSSFAAALRQQQQLLAQQQMIQGNKTLPSSSLHRLGLGPTPGSNGTNFSMASEDFPALPGALNSSSTNIPLGSGLLGGVDGGAGQRDLPFPSSTSASSFGTSVQQQQLSINSTPGTSNSMFGPNLESISKHFDSSSLAATNISGHGSITGISSTTNPAITHPPQRSTSGPMNVMSSVGSTSGGQGATGAAAAISGDYGLLGLLKVIRMTDADRNALALGSDLTSLGLNLNSSETLYSHFASPWSDNPTTREPQYQLPLCYYMQPPALKTGHLSKFQLETLFYIFYAMPRDLLQAFSAQELYSREWRYHIELKLWFKRAGVADGIALSSAAVQYIYFDISTWERRLASGNMSQNIVAGLLPEDEVRVKFQSS